MERVPHTYLFMYRKSTALAPPPDLPPVVVPVISWASSYVPAVLRHHVVPTHKAQMVLSVQNMCIPA